MPLTTAPPETDSGLLAYARGQRAVADAAEVELLRAACWWADAHPACGEPSSHLVPGMGISLPLGGVGCPEVEEFSVAEFAAAIGATTESGKQLVGHALELRHRLPLLWAKVEAGAVSAWRARRVADRTMVLSPEAAGHVDRHLAPVAGTHKPWQLDRLVDDAVARYMPERAAAQRRAAAESRFVEVATDQVGSITGTTWIRGELDLADALDLDAALAEGAAALAAAGSTDPLDARRSIALGDLARGQSALPMAPSESSGEGTRPRRRLVTLYVHLSQSALTDLGHGDLGRLENTRSPLTVDQIRAWCGRSDAHVTVRPVLDLADHVPATAYEIPDRVREQVSLRDPTCVFPWCTRPARHLDCDHVTAYTDGGPTCACNLAPLCRTHHRLKTHDHRGAGWAYTPLEPGSYLWRSPLGLAFLRDHTGTRDVTAADWTARHLPTHALPAPRD